MIELWHCPDARSFRVLWALEEMGLPYELHVLPFPPRARAPAYLEVNPLGTIPAMRDGATFMTESAAIVQYLVTRHGPSDLAVPVEDDAYGAWPSVRDLAASADVSTGLAAKVLRRLRTKTASTETTDQDPS